MNRFVRHSVNFVAYQDPSCPAIACEQDDIRLQNGQNKFEGHVEVCNGGYWKTVCSNMWDDEEASVACRQIGFAGISSCKPKTISKVGR